MRTRHAIAVLGYLLGALYLTADLLPDRITASNERDYAFFQMVFSHAAHSLNSPFLEPGLNAPFGVNMMANTSMLGLSLPLAPVTLTLGPQVSFFLVLLIALAGTATAWYWFLLRHITKNWWLALIGGALCGFSPAMVSHANAHPNIAAGFMVPLIISRVIELRRNPLRDGIILGLMIVYQLFINEEILLYTALACLVMALAAFPRDPRPYVKGLGIAAGVSLVIMAYPLWFQFFGPQHYTGPFWWADGYGIDLAAYPAYATRSLAGDPALSDPLGSSQTEQNAFYGWPLCLLTIIAGIALWRVVAVRVAFLIGVVLAALSLGELIKINTVQTRVPGPWSLVSDLPLFDSIIVTRLGLGVAPAMAVIGVVAMQRLIKWRSPSGAMISAGLAMIALGPLVPTPLPVTDKPAVPAFFTDGTWQRYVDGGTILPVPPDVWTNDSLNWLVATRMRARIADGYFIGPRTQLDPVANFGPEVRPTGRMLNHVAASGSVPVLTAANRQQFRVDMDFWQVDALVLAREVHREELRALVTDLTGVQGIETGGVIVWDIR